MWQLRAGILVDMSRFLYTLLFHGLLPFILLRLWLRGGRAPAYRQRLGERLGLGLPALQPGGIWVHAVSVGESIAAAPLIRALLERHPQLPLIVTCMTPTGSERIRALFGDRVQHCYLPWDLPWAAARFLDRVRPKLALIMETELWPNHIHQCARRGIPTVLANARLSARSARGYGRIGALARPAFASLAGVAAQTADDAARLAELGVAPVEVCGNLKFDVQPPADKLALGRQWRAALGERPVWLAASTREGEEEPVLQAWRSVAPEALLVLVPRHPQRFAEVAALLGARGIEFARRSEGLPGPASRVWLGDSMGEMAAYYALADLAFVGGSLLPLGGQNLIEAAACGCPVLVGPHTFNFKQATEDALAAGAALRVADADALGVAVDRLLADETALAGMREAAQSFARAHQGATGRMLALIADWSGRAAR